VGSEMCIRDRGYEGWEHEFPTIFGKKEATQKFSGAERGKYDAR